MAQVTRRGIKSTAIQAPTDDQKNHTTVLRQLKECIEIAQRLRGDLGDSYVRVSELESAGIIRLVSGVVQPPNTNSPPGAAVPATRTVTGADSIAGGGDLLANRVFTLVNDAATPGNNKYYGTDGSGTKGFFTASGGASSPLTTKGDLWGYDTADDRIPVGSNGQVLVADSAAALGVKWGTPSGGGSSNVTPDSHPTSPNALDDEFEGTSLDAKWTVTRGTLTTTTFGGGAIYLSDSSNSSDNWAGYGQASTGNIKIRCKLFLAGENADNRGGIYVARGGTKFMVFGLFNNSGVATFYVNKQTSPSGAATNLFTASSAVNMNPRAAGPFYLQIEYDGTNLKFYGQNVGYNSYFDVALGSETAATFLGGAPDEVGIFSDRGSSNTHGCAIDWFRAGF